jgi:hypothetical protein
LFGVCLGLQKSYREAATIEKPLPGAEKPTNEILAIPQVGETAKDTDTPTGYASASHGTMRLDTSRHYTPSVPPQEVSFSQKREIKERTLMPGVTYQSGEGISMAVDEDEKVLIRRDNTYRSKEVQVMWKKTF